MTSSWKSCFYSQSELKILHHATALLGERFVNGTMQSMSFPLYLLKCYALSHRAGVGPWKKKVHTLGTTIYYNLQAVDIHYVALIAYIFTSCSKVLD